MSRKHAKPFEIHSQPFSNITWDNPLANMPLFCYCCFIFTQNYLCFLTLTNDVIPASGLRLTDRDLFGVCVVSTRSEVDVGAP